MADPNGLPLETAIESRGRPVRAAFRGRQARGRLSGCVAVT